MTHLADAPAVFRTTDLSAAERYLIEWGYATRLCSDPYSTHDAKYVLALYNVHSVIIVITTRSQSNLTKSASRGANSPVRGHPRGSKVVPLNSWGRVSY